MNLYSTNDKNNIVDLKTAVLNAFPVDRGLYMPTRIPRLPETFLNNMESLSFQELSAYILNHLTENHLSLSVANEITEQAFDFDVPLVRIMDRVSVLELFHGPTLAFKDFGARFMARLMAHFLKQESQQRTILVATSGDTGGAVASGFYGINNIEVIILFPKGKVSERQEKQLCCWGQNIHAVEVEGSFDDCQALVKEAFLDVELNKRYAFSSANSINIARLIPQSFYYFEAFKQVKDKSKDIVFTVPSGNFGNLTAGLMAKKMGLNIRHFIAATNSNDTVPQYLASGDYLAKTSVPTLSNAMDVGNPSNFPRMLELYGSTWNMIKNDITGISVSDKTTIKTLQQINSDYKYILDPHTAVGVAASLKHQTKDNNYEHIILGTAHPAKFDDTIRSFIEDDISIPERLSIFDSKSKIKIRSEKHFQSLKDILLSR